VIDPASILSDTAAGLTPEPGEDPIAILDRMIQDALAFIQTQKTDEVDTATMTGILQKLQQFKAEEQKEIEGMMRGKVSPRAIVNGYGG
jgi:hypothetical protein